MKYQFKIFLTQCLELKQAHLNFKTKYYKVLNLNLKKLKMWNYLKEEKLNSFDKVHKLNKTGKMLSQNYKKTFQKLK